ncbi:MAG: dolichyl-phosphate beta-glucosyltransferase [Planctomycetota bacterium]
MSLVIPVFNEASCLEENLNLVDAFMRRLFKDDYEIICVDDGSRDDSLSILHRFQNRCPLRVKSHEQNRGKGAAIKTGMTATKGDIVFFFDADLSTPLDEIRRFLPCFDQGADMVIGTRKSSDADIKKFQPLHRVIMGMGYTYLVNLIMGLKISDFTCGFKAFTRKATDEIFPRLRIDGWSYDVEILYLARHLGFEVVEVPVTWANKPGSKVSLVKDTVRSFSELLKIRKLHKDKVMASKEVRIT